MKKNRQKVYREYNIYTCNGYSNMGNMYISVYILYPIKIRRYATVFYIRSFCNLNH